MSARRTHRWLTGIAAGTVASALLVGCETETAPESLGGISASDDRLTPLGTALSLGQSATVPVEGGDGIIELTVVSIEPGDPEDLGGHDRMPYFVRLEATVVAGDGAGFFAERTVAGLFDDERLNTIVSPATIGPCSWVHFPQPAVVGATIEPCITAVVDPGGLPVDQVGYFIDGDGFSEGDPYVRWS